MVWNALLLFLTPLLFLLLTSPLGNFTKKQNKFSVKCKADNCALHLEVISCTSYWLRGQNLQWETANAKSQTTTQSKTTGNPCWFFWHNQMGLLLKRFHIKADFRRVFLLIINLLVKPFLQEQMNRKVFQKMLVREHPHFCYIEQCLFLNW